MATAAPSIPSRWETTLHRLPQENRGFGIQSTRIKLSWNDRPGPGTYHDSAKVPMLLEGPSLSKKGYGNCFVSKTPIGWDATYVDNMVPGPGSYESKGMQNGDFRKPMSSFAPSGKGRVPFPDPNKNPGPLDYNANEFRPHDPLKMHKSASFRSTSGRESFLVDPSEAPPVGSYTANNRALDPIPSEYWSKSTNQRFQMIGVDNKVPHAAKYFDEVATGQYEKAKIDTNQRSMGKFKGRYLGKQNDNADKKTIHSFGADLERFKHSFLGRLDLAGDMPGPGAYNVRKFVTDDPELRIQTASPVRTGTVKTSTANAFGSSDSRLAKQKRKEVPGPAYYAPKSIPRKVQTHQNLDKKWV